MPNNPDIAAVNKKSHSHGNGLPDMRDETAEHRKRLRRADPLASDFDLRRRAASELEAERRRAILIEKRAHLVDIRAKRARTEEIGAILAAGMAETEAEAIRALNVGSGKTFHGAGKSVDAMANGLFRHLAGSMIQALKKGGNDRYLRILSKESLRDIAQEMSRLGDNRQAPSGNKNAAEIAAIFDKYLEAARLLQNKAGAWIDRRAGYIAVQSHDMFRIARAGFEKWRKVIEPLLDESTFEGIADRDAFLHDVFKALSTGKHLKIHGKNDWLAKAAIGSGKFARRVGQGRVLHFKTADSWCDYNERFGEMFLLDAVIGHLNRAAKNTALMRVWGTNPEAAFLRQVEPLDNWRGTDKILGEAEFDHLTGAASIPAIPTLAKWTNIRRILQSTAKLGDVLIPSFPDIAIRAAKLKHNGANYLEALDEGFRNILHDRDNAERLEIADLIGIGITGLLGGILGQFSATDDWPGHIGKLLDVFFKANSLTWWADSQASGIGFMLSRNLANRRHLAFDALDPDLADNLNRYGIGEREWESIRQAKVGTAEDQRFLTPDAIEALDDAAIRAYIGDSEAAPEKIAAARGKLRSDFETYFVDQTGEAMVMAGARRRGSISEAVRFLMQFKAHGITFINRSAGRELKRGDFAALQHVLNIGQFMLTMTALGHVLRMAKDLTQGRDPRDPKDWETWLSAMAQGGGLSVYGDALFGEFHRFGKGAWETSAGTIGDFGRIWAAVIRGEDTGADILQNVKNRVPLLNLFYTRMALDYLFLYRIQESMNPGYLRRMEKTIARENRQRFLLPASGMNRSRQSTL